MTKPIRVLVADDHEIVRFGICSVLRTSADIEVAGESSTGKETLELYRELKPDVVLVDISMPDMNGIEATNAIISEDRTARILILSMHLDEEYLHQVLRAGALGYLLKNSDIDELISAIKMVFNRQQVFSDSVSQIMTKRYVRDAREKTNEESAISAVTQREHEILQLIVQGKTSAEIATDLFISPRTVETHRANLMQKLKIKNVAGLIRFAIDKGLVEDIK